MTFWEIQVSAFLPRVRLEDQYHFHVCEVNIRLQHTANEVAYSTYDLFLKLTDGFLWFYLQRFISLSTDPPVSLK